ncbi:MAG: relaxase/mobilization nuclease domain-containing protein [Cellvibrionaceae bacterium]
MSNSTDLRLAELHDSLRLGIHKGAGKKVRLPSTGKSKKGITAATKANNLRTALKQITQKHPEVMVKISGGGRGMKHAKNHITYISRRGELDLTDQDGNVVNGKAEVKELLKEWQTSGSFIPEESQRKEVFNMIFSMPRNTPPEAVLESVKALAKEEFANNDYVMALHTYDTDPDPKPSPNPHVHLAVKARGYDGKRLNPRKTDLRRYRESFAENLRENGVDAVATSRAQRFVQEKRPTQAIKHILERGDTPTTQGRVSSDEVIARAKKTQLEILDSYREVVKTLAKSNLEDRELAVDLAKTLFGGEGRDVVMERGGDDRE